tara:strand:- start:97 stop:948 length:852 start_codon:yes stop_codon:yes gene_type:complete
MKTGILVKIIALIISLFILTSCSKTRIFYNYSDWFVLKWFDTYFDLNDPQRFDLKMRIVRLLDWHRKSELAKIAEHLKQLKSRYQKGLKGKDIDWIGTEHKLFWNRIIDRAKPDLIAFLSTIEEVQVQQMERELIEKNDWLVKQSKMTTDEAHASTLKWFFELLEKWLGDLEPNQKLKISSWIKADPEWTAIKLKNRKKFQTELAQILRSKENFKENLHIWLHEPETYWTEGFKNRLEYKKQEWKKIILKVDEITLPRQRQHVANELKNYIDDFLTLSKQTAS